jgi:hypothetical protein
MKVEIFRSGADIVVIGQDFEAADYTNPRGNIYGFSSFVQAVSTQGDTRILHVATGSDEAEVLAKADTLAAALNARLASGKLPVAFDRWEEGRAVYGSEAYGEYGQDEDLAWESRAAEEEVWA